jgi:hypothetical protein
MARVRMIKGYGARHVDDVFRTSDTHAEEMVEMGVAIYCDQSGFPLAENKMITPQYSEPVVVLDEETVVEAQKEWPTFIWPNVRRKLNDAGITPNNAGDYTVEELTNVKGIGIPTAEKILAWANAE